MIVSVAYRFVPHVNHFLTKKETKIKAKTTLKYLLGHIKSPEEFGDILITALPWKTSSSNYALPIDFVINRTVFNRNGNNNSL